jgi:hypothetical protein
MKTRFQVAAAVATSFGLFSGTSHGERVTTGSVVCFGLGRGVNEHEYDFGQSRVPLGLGPCTSVAAGGFHSVAITQAGAIQVWGANYYGQLSVPGDAMPAREVVCGVNHTVALTTSGNVVAWGMNIQGQCAVPEDLGACMAIGAGGIHSLAVRSNGQILGWGFNMNGQASPPSQLVAVAVAGMYLASAALTEHGMVVVWGNCPPLKDVGPFVGLTATPWSDRIVALRPDGSVASNYSWSGIPEGSGPFVEVRSYGTHSLGVEIDGDIVAWGGNNWSQTTIPANACDGLGIAAGYGHSIALMRDSDIDQICDSLDACPSEPGIANTTVLQCNGCPLAASRSCLLAYGDLNADRTIGGEDLGIMLASWGSEDMAGDLNVDRIIDGADLGILLSRWGACP